MTTKTFTGSSIQEAIGKVKDNLGVEALILSTKRIPRGPQDPYGKDLFEITAAASDTEPESDGAAANDTKLETDGAIADVHEALTQIKNMLFLSNRSGGIRELLELHPDCLNLYGKLIRSGISEDRAWSLLKAGGAFCGDPVPADVVAGHVIKSLISSLSVYDPFAAENGIVAAFVGPTGVGKTTTIAKLCAELSLKRKKRVGIISVDSYRIGAVEQLKTYAAIMGLPCLSAFSRGDLLQALNKMNDRDVILIDTAGQSHRDKDRLKELGQLMKGDQVISTHLVMSVTGKPADMREAADNFAILKPKSYVFTKVDETSTRGGIIDQVIDYKLPISFVTNGQKVPEDIMTATRKRVLKVALGHER
ncbi:MAG: protein FlhF [Deltaproteobacteria bacterium]|nr:protein FlhF [Deltaproteobacteria bacterium]